MEQVAFQKISASAPVFSSGTPVEIWGGWVGQGQINFWTGTDASSGTEEFILNTNVPLVVFSAGVVFPNGCYIEDGSSGHATVFYRTLK